ncbi:MAG: hypothetical protein COZ28_03260 [Candidatus Moranbacteria bacterium CG_4_10_14_3_um_filter_44_15]
MKKHLSIFLAFAVIFSLFLSGCGTTTPNYRVDLEIWGLFDDSDVFSKAIGEYQKRNPRVREINYKKLTVDSYETDILEALATGNGPDIFLIHNTWLAKHKDKLVPVPTDNSSGNPVEILNARQIRDQFVDVVSADFVSENQIYALPLSVDSLALFYNRDLLNQAGVTRPPETWIEFDEAVKKITKIDSFGNIILSGAAMGTSSDVGPGEGKINRATDILTLLMMQAGTEMTDSKMGSAAFAEFSGAATGNEMSPGESALSYYTKFSSPYKKEYSWNSLQHNAIDSFTEGKTVMMLNYSWLIPRIQSRSPKLNLGIAKIPQNKLKDKPGISVDFANYWGLAVSKNKVAVQEDLQRAKDNKVSYATNDQRVAESWKFLRYLTLPPSFSQDLPVGATEDAVNFDPAKGYVENQKKPAARRDLIEAQKSDPLLGPFVEGNLIARSWAQPDNLAVEKIFDEMIDDVILRNESPREVLRQGQNAVNLLMRK